MAEPIGAVRVDLTTNRASFEKDMKAARDTVRATSSDITKALSNFRNAALSSASSLLSVKSAAVVAAGAAGIGYVIKQALDAADKIGDMAQATGLSVSAYQELAYAAQAAGVSQDDFNKGLIKLTVAIQDARLGTGPLVTALKDTNPELLNIIKNSKGTEEGLYRILDAAEGMGNVFERNKFLISTFGKVAGPEMIQMLDKGKGALNAAREDARKFGAVLGDDVVANAGAAKDKLAALEFVIKQQLIGAVAQFSPQIFDLAQRFLQGLPGLIAWVDKMGQFFGILDKSRVQAFEEEIAGLNDEINRLDALKQDNRDGRSLVDRIFGGTKDEFSAELDERLAILLDRQAEVQRKLDEARKGVTPPPAPKPFILSGGDSGDAETEAAKIKKVVDALKLEAENLERSTLDQAVYNAAKKEGITDIDGLRDAMRGLFDTMETRKAIDEEQKKLDADDADRKEAAKQLIKETRTETERLTEETQKLYDMKANLVEILGDEAKADEVIRRGIRDLNDDSKKLENGVRDLGLSFTSAFEDAAAGGKEFSDIVAGLENDIYKLFLRMTVTEPLLKEFQKIVKSGMESAGGSGGLGGLFQGLFNFGGSSQGSGAYTDVAGANYGGADGGYATGGSFMVGGKAGRDRVPVKFMASRGERVDIKTPGQQANDGGGAMISNDTTVIINTPPGSKAQAQESQGPGGRTIEVMIDEAVASNIGQPGSRTGRAIRNTFGANPTLKGR